MNIATHFHKKETTLVQPSLTQGPVRSLPSLASVAQPEWPSPQSQSLSRSYGSILPTSLIYIILLTRGYEPWRPDAVMSTAGTGCISTPLPFQGTSRAHRTAEEVSRFAARSAPSSREGIPGPSERVKKKRELFPGPGPSSAGLNASPLSTTVHTTGI